MQWQPYFLKSSSVNVNIAMLAMQDISSKELFNIKNNVIFCLSRKMNIFV